MLTIGIPQLYCGASGQKGAYNRQEVGLARAFASLGCRAVAIYPDPSLTAPKTEDLEPLVRVLYLPARALGDHAFYKSWQPLLDEKIDAVHVMGDNSLGVPGLYRFCRRHGIYFYSQLGALKSASNSAAARLVMNLLLRRNLAVYRKTPAFAKTPAAAAELQSLGVPCAGVLPVGLDTAIIPAIPGEKADIRAELGLVRGTKYLLFVGRIDPYKRPMALVPLMQALEPDWRLIVIGQGSQAGALDAALAPLGDRYRRIPKLPNTAVHAYYHACDVFVNLNDREIFGMSLLEAMYAGCPPVARRAPGPELIIQDGVSGILADSDGALPAAVCRAAASPAMGRAAQQRVNDEFLWGSSAEKALDLLAREGVHGRG
ncbi:glycosyltransferase family 4 protein [uncultured Gemmiger sp.]|uniref:glycosyltransferase family 4 protein n=1 Tax=uncultured Gemmiger sp. TaxID=1623490 RepID=UPI0025FE013B|nr:glycosyltransferase family 4 protein [uncultured Gemmiger sp.]